MKLLFSKKLLCYVMIFLIGKLYFVRSKNRTSTKKFDPQHCDEFGKSTKSIQSIQKVHSIHREKMGEN